MSEADVAHVFIVELPQPALGEVPESATPYFADERVEDTVAVGQEGHESAVRRNRGVHLRARKVGEPLDAHLRPAISPRYIGPFVSPRHDRASAEGEKDDGNPRAPRPASRRRA